MRNDLRLPGVLMIARAWEPQTRGVAHAHVVIPLRYFEVIVGWLRAHAADFGFGFVDDGRGSRRGRLRPGSRAADAGAYLASYIGSAGKVDDVCEAIAEGVIPSRSFYVSPRLSDGFTMRFLRLRRRAWAVVNVGAPVPMWCTAIQWGEALQSVGAIPSAGADPP